MNHLRNFIASIVIALFSCACAVQRAPVPIGTVPDPTDVSAADEQYGQEVFSELATKFPISHDDAKIERVRNVVDRLTKAARADQNPWHVYVLDDPKFKNAAATRGDYIFVWSGMLDAVNNDDELATVLAHEIGHVLAGHTMPDPSEEVNQMITGIAGEIASGVVSSRAGSLGGDLAGALVQQGLNAFIVNPGLQRKELEADQIGLFLMADGGYDPKSAVGFWKRVETDPEFGGTSLAFLSTHPSSTERYERLEKMLPQAEARYAGHKNGDSFAFGKGTVTRAASRSKQPNETYRQDKWTPRSEEISHRSGAHPETVNPTRALVAHPSLRPEAWEVVEPTTTVYSAPRNDSHEVTSLSKGARVVASRNIRGWLYVSKPVQGYVPGKDLSPVQAPKK